MDWNHLLAYITGTVEQALLVRNEYLVTEHRILRNQLKERVRRSDGERTALAEIGQKLGKQALLVVGRSTWLASRRIPMQRGWSRWHAM
jgi:putative transposase